MIITIDGPVSSGKSTVARMLAKKLGYYYLNSGLLFRALAYLLVNHCLYTEKELRNPTLDDLETYLDPERFSYEYDETFREKIVFDGQDITPRLKGDLIGKYASIMSTDARVRKALAEIQRLVAQYYDVIVDGRDSGSVVFPDTQIKFFLTAPAEVRAKRWQQEQKERGNDFSLQEALERINERDKRDKERNIAPLSIPDEAIIINSADLNPQQTCEVMLTHIKREEA